MPWPYSMGGHTWDLGRQVHFSEFTLLQLIHKEAQCLQGQLPNLIPEPQLHPELSVLPPAPGDLPMLHPEGNLRQTLQP